MPSIPVGFHPEVIAEAAAARSCQLDVLGNVPDFYFLKVADRLGVGDAARKKGRTAAGGKEAMELMAKSTATALGLTQISEILSVKEVELVGPYPGDLQNMTTYTGIVLTRTPQPEAAQAFLRFLASPPAQARFKQAGFDPPAR